MFYLLSAALEGLSAGHVDEFNLKRRGIERGKKKKGERDRVKEERGRLKEERRRVKEEGRG